MHNTAVSLVFIKPGQLLHTEQTWNLNKTIVQLRQHLRYGQQAYDGESANETSTIEHF